MLETAIYLGNIVSKNNFRVFIYHADGDRKLVNSWDEYSAHMTLGTWFADKNAVDELINKRTKRARKAVDKQPVVEVDSALHEANELAVEVRAYHEVVKDSMEDFLPKG